LRKVFAKPLFGEKWLKITVVRSFQRFFANSSKFGQFQKNLATSKQTSKNACFNCKNIINNTLNSKIIKENEKILYRFIEKAAKMV
jgi:hypothetical protein